MAPSGRVPTFDGEQTPRCRDGSECARSCGALPPTPGDALHDRAGSMWDPASPQEAVGHSKADHPAGSRARWPCKSIPEISTCQGPKGSSEGTAQSE